MDLGIDVNHSSSHGACTHGLKVEGIISDETASWDGASMLGRNEKEGKDQANCVELESWECSVQVEARHART